MRVPISRKACALRERRPLDNIPYKQAVDAFRTVHRCGPHGHELRFPEIARFKERAGDPPGHIANQWPRNQLPPLRSLLSAPAASGHELRNEAMRLELHAGPDGVYLARLALNRKPGWPGKGFSDNLLPGRADTTLLRSGTAILVEGSSWHGSRMPDPSKVTAGPGWQRLEGIELGPGERPIAREEWSLELGACGLRWRRERARKSAHARWHGRLGAES